MLTLDFPFTHAKDDFEIYQNFIKDPATFFDKHEVIFDSDDEKLEMCQML